MSTITPTAPATARLPARRVLGRLRGVAGRIDAATPTDRDRVMDLLRVCSMLVVALGHWVMAVVWVDADGTIATESLLVAEPRTQVATLALQVMGLFFAVGGWASARSLRTRPDSWSAWVHSRIRRLLAPTTAYVAAVAVLVPVVAASVGPDAAGVARRAFTVHLWFCAAVVPLYVLTPALHAAWRAWGPRLLGVLVGTAAIVDVAHRVLDRPVVGVVNFPLVWGAATLIGFAWADGLLDRATARRMVLWGTTTLAALVATPWVPLAMVGVDGATHSNNSPPSVVLVALTAVHVGAVVLATPALRRATARPLVWAAVALAGRAAVTVYLWHLLALGLLVAVVAQAAPAVLGVAPLGAVWWATRPLWLAALAVATVPLVAVALPLERRLGPVEAPGTVRTVLAAGLASLGCGVLVLDGLGATWAVLAVVAAAVVGRWLPAMPGARGATGA